MPRIVITKLLSAERQHVFDVIANYENLQQIMPKYYPSVRVRSVRDNVAIVEEHLNIGGKELVMTTKHISKYPESHDVFVLGGDAKGSHISEVYEKTDQGTKLTITADIKLGTIAKLSGVIGKSRLESDYNTMIDDFCKIL
ncbi:MAG: polyketide cyclase [Nitrososphaeria archaeon]|nr:polyketide cyclase [Nitrososphaeria archaeon]NDB50736.1 polyketide cyclase [Nitrosopumilaceae archaeon]NDB89892.1 polyketide cyclase [Nitrososphaerota archaeon]NDB46106.1 polyketide cyclase [Nitrososphaeria archaeon]NDB63035.1 polyketide cyclase [Nitrosopumilaceae archaeon]